MVKHENSKGNIHDYNIYKTNCWHETWDTNLSCKLGYRLFRKSSSSRDRPGGPLSKLLATVVSVELILVKSELVDPNMALAVRPAAMELRYLASAPGALLFTRPPSCSGAVGGGVRLPVSGLGLPPRPYEAGHLGR